MLLNQRRKKYKRWDDKILLAHYMLTDYEVEGWPIWVDTSARVEFEAKTRKSKSGAAIERAQWLSEKAQSKKKGDSPPPFGVRHYAVPKTLDGKPLPRKKDWLLAQQGKEPTNVFDADKVAEFRDRRKAKGSVN